MSLSNRAELANRVQSLPSQDQTGFSAAEEMSSTFKRTCRLYSSESMWATPTACWSRSLCRRSSCSCSPSPSPLPPASPWSSHCWLVSAQVPPCNQTQLSCSPAPCPQHLSQRTPSSTSLGRWTRGCGGSTQVRFTLSPMLLPPGSIDHKQVGSLFRLNVFFVLRRSEGRRS